MCGTSHISATDLDAKHFRLDFSDMDFLINWKKTVLLTAFVIILLQILMLHAPLVNLHSAAALSNLPLQCFDTLG